MIPQGGYPPFPPRAGGQPPRPRPPFWQSWYLVLVVGGAVLVLVVVPLVAIVLARGHTHAIGNNTTGTTSMPVSSTLDQWQTSVCSGPPVAPTQNYWTHSATESSLCTAQHGVSLVYGRYTSQEVMQSDVARIPRDVEVATLTADNAVHLFYTLGAAPQTGMEALEPLVRFGFKRYYVGGGSWRPGP